jgi:hypothetical protein
MKEIMLARGYVLEYTTSKTYIYVKKMDRKGKRFHVSCEIDSNDGAFTFQYVAPIVHYVLRSSTYRPFRRDDFDELEYYFTSYAVAVETTVVNTALI